MRSRLRFLIGATSAAAITVLAAGATTTKGERFSSSADSISVAKVVSDFHSALSRGDSAKALSLLATDAVILESGGVESRSEYRTHHLPEDIKFAKGVATKRGTLQLRVEGSSAWTVGTSTTHGKLDGRAINSVGAESMVITKQTAGWRIRSIHWSSRESHPQ